MKSKNLKQKNIKSNSSEKIKVLLLEGIDSSAPKLFKDKDKDRGNSNGCYDYDVECISTALSKDELIVKLQDVHILGIRSRTILTKEVIHSLKKSDLIAIGCYCIGTDQVDLQAASLCGIPVFNAPHSNTRSVAELVLGLIVMLMRDVFPKSCAAHQGQWLKGADGAHELRGKTLGIVGYGHIGSQVSILAESFGMHVLYYDIVSKLPLGNARAVSSLKELLKQSDVVTLHVPGGEECRNLLDESHMRFMKKGAYLVNASRGAVVDIDGLNSCLETGHIRGAAVDVFPVEPKGVNSEFLSPLRGNMQVILTPHIGGSTVEAQYNIGLEVSQKLIQYIESGSTMGAVNFPQLSLVLQKDLHDLHRIIHIHHNIPGMLKQINQVIADENINVVSQYLLTNGEIGYVVFDIEGDIANQVKLVLASLDNIEGTIRTRYLHSA